MKLAEVVSNRARRCHNNPAVCYHDAEEGSIITYGSLIEALEEHQTWIHRAIPFSSTSEELVVAYLAENSVDLFLSVIACANRDDVTTALLNTRWTPREMATALQQRGPNLILCSTEFKSKADDLVKLLPGATSSLIPDLATAMIRREWSLTPPAREDDTANLIQALTTDNEASSDALVVFTSGTTSGPKGVRLSHRAILIQALAKTQSPCSYSSETAVLGTTVGFFHVGGLSSILATWLAGGMVVLPSRLQRSNTSFDPQAVERSVRHERLPTTTLVVVPTMVHSLMECMDTTNIYPRMRLILVGGQSASEDMIAFLRAVFPNAKLVQTYACSEAASSLTFLTIQRGREQTASADCVGYAPRHVQLRLVHPETGRTIEGPNETGIISTRGPHLMNGYWKRHSVLPNMDVEYWMRTTDLGFWSVDGSLNFAGRVNDTIRSGGETVLALEVEKIVAKHPSVKEVAVFGLPDKTYGEAVCCAIVASSPLDIAELRQWCKEHDLTGFKRPRRLFTVSTLPKNGSGKVLKAALRDSSIDSTAPQSKL